MSKKEVVVKEEQLPLVMPEGDWDDGEFETKDLLLPRICVANGTSEIVKQGKAKIGDIYETVNKTVLGDGTKSFNFVPFKTFKTWIHSEIVNNRPQFRSMEEYITTGPNANDKKYTWEEKKADGTMWRHDEVLNFYVLLEEDLKKANPFPYLLAFRATNKKKGKPLINHMAMAKGMVPPKPLCSKIFSLKSVMASKGMDSWAVFDVMPKAGEPETPIEWMIKCRAWLDSLATTKHVVDTTDLSDEVGGEEVVEVTPKKEAKKGEVSSENRY